MFSDVVFFLCYILTVYNINPNVISTSRRDLATIRIRPCGRLEKSYVYVHTNQDITETNSRDASENRPSGNSGHSAVMSGRTG